MGSVLGIDVSKANLDVVLINGKRLKHKVFTNGPRGHQGMARWLVAERVGPLRVCLEATGQYGEAIAEYLYQRGYAVSVVNPARIKRYGESKLHRNKTDKADAALIAEFCQKENPPLWAPLPAEIQHLRALVRRLHDLQINYQQECNRLQAGGKNPWVQEDVQLHLNYLKSRIQVLRQAIQKHIQQHPRLKSQQELLISIPGIGKLTAARLLAEIGDFSAFENAPQLAAFAGLNPKNSRSGSSIYRKAHISKEGSAFVRYTLYMPALVAIRHNPVIQALAKRLDDRKLPKKAIVIAAMRKLSHLAFGVLKNQTPFDPDYGKQFLFSA